MAGVTRYSVGVTALTTGLNTACLEVVPATRGFSVRSITGLQFTAATASTFSISRSGALGITPGTLKRFEALSNSTTPPTTSQAQVAASWGTPPTLGANILGLLMLTTAAGSTMTWAPSVPITIMPGQSLIIFNSTANAATPLFTIEIDELAD